MTSHACGLGVRLPTGVDTRRCSIKLRSPRASLSSQVGKQMPRAWLSAVPDLKDVL